EAYQDTLSKSKLVKSGPDYEMVKRVADGIAKAANEPSFQWDVALIQSSEVNAWCLPGGKMGVYTGIIPVAKTEQGLAVVLGHEVAHAVSHHGGRRMTESMGTELVGQLASIGFSKSSPAVQQGAMTAFGLGSNVAVALPFSRSDESEADHIGLILMAKAGYDPREAPEFWKRMQSMAGSSDTPEFLSTHPVPSTRIADLKTWMPEALAYYEKKGSAAPAPANASAGTKTTGDLPQAEVPPAPAPKKKLPSGGGL
ncbi:MAG TPA: M48 family metallopeptidase, partial [Planctomycetota bacterium]|nr:M48 family metallopeptidase [Planctomycetota bacterium]